MCTSIRFTSKDGNMYFGRNLDWNCGYGEQVLTVPRNFKRTWCFAQDNTIANTASTQDSPAIIGMGIVEEGVPLFFDCANEHGLAIAGLNFPGWAAYEDSPVQGKQNVAAYEFPFWVVNNFKTVDEAEAALSNVAIVARPINDKYPVAFLHWIIADKTRSIVVEYTKDGMHIFHDDLDTLTNQPGFEWHHENVRNYIAVTNEVPQDTAWDKHEMSAYGSGFGMHGLPGDFSSPSRFVRAAYFNARYPVQDSEQDNVARLFHTLSGAAMVKGGAKMSNGDFEFTLYTGGYSAATQTYYHNTYDDAAIIATRMSDTDLDGTTIAVAS